MASTLDKIFSFFEKLGSRGNSITGTRSMAQDTYKKGIARAKQRAETRKNLGIDNTSTNFWNVDEKARRQYKTANPLAEAELRKKYPGITDQEVDDAIGNRIKRDIMRRSNHPKVKEQYNEWFDKDGNFTSKGLAEWRNADDYMAQIAMENDIDGLSDEREGRKDEEWYKEWGKAYMDLYDSNYGTTMRQAAKKYLDDSQKSGKNVQTTIENYKFLNQRIAADGKTREDHIKDFEQLASDVSQDADILFNPEKYEDLKEYNRLKDVGDLKLSDDQKLRLYAQYYTDYNRGGQKYAAQKLAQYFQDEMAKHLTFAEKCMKWKAGFQDDMASLMIGTAGLIYGLNEAIRAGAFEALGYKYSDKGPLSLFDKLGMQTEEDKQRREGQRWWQYIFDNALVDYGNRLSETHVWNPEDQIKMQKMGLQDDQFYKTAEQEESLLSTADIWSVTSNYGFTAASTIMSGGASSLAKGIVSGALKTTKAIRGVSNAAKWTKSLKAAAKWKDAINVTTGMIIATGEGAGITLQNKSERYHANIQGLQNKYFIEKIKEDPELAAALLKQAGVQNVPDGTWATTEDGGGRLIYTDKQIEQIAEQFNSNADDIPDLEAYKQQKIQEYEQQHADDVAIDYEQIQDRVEDAATAEFLAQAAVNGFIAHGMKNTLYSKPMQKARKNVSRRVKTKLGIKDTPNAKELAKHVTLEQAKDGTWSAKAVAATAKDLAKERVKESYGEALEEGLQDVMGAFGEGFNNYAYQNYIDSRFGDKDNVNTGTAYTWLRGIGEGLAAAGAAVLSEETLMDALYGGLSTSIGGLNVNTNYTGGFKKALNLKGNWQRSKEANPDAGFLGHLSNLSPITWRGAWTPFINKSEVNAQQSRNDELAKRLNEFFKDKDLQEKLMSAGGINSFISEYNKALKAGDEFSARNARFGSIFSTVNLLDKLKGTAYYDAITRSLDKRIEMNQDNMSDQQIKDALDAALTEEGQDNDVAQVLREAKGFIPNVEGNKNEDEDFSGTDENVAIVRRAAENAQNMKDLLNTISEKKEQLQRDFGAEFDDDGMDAVLYQQLSMADKKKRMEGIDDKLQQITPFSKDKQSENTSAQAIVNYGSLESLRTSKEELQATADALRKVLDGEQKEIDEIRAKKEAYEKALEENGYEETDEIAQMAPTVGEQLTLSTHEKYREDLNKADKALARIEKQEKALSKAVEYKIQGNQTDGMLESAEETPVLTERDIMELDAASRAYILAEKNKKKYSKKQQQVIDQLNQKGREAHGMEWDQMIQDAARLERQYNLDMAEQNRILYDHKSLTDYINKAKTNRLKKAKVDQYEYLFNEAIEAMNNSEDEAEANGALNKLAEFLLTPSEDQFTEMAKQELRNKYKNSAPMQKIDANIKSLNAFYADIENADILVQEEIQQSEDSSVNSEERPSIKTEEERVITDNDRNLINYALTYAAAHNIPLDEIPDMVTTQEFADFVDKQNEKYAQQKSNTHLILDPADAKRFMQSAINYHKELVALEEQEARERQAKQDAIRPAASVAPKPIVPSEPDDNGEPAPEPEPSPQEPEDNPEEDDREIPENLEIGIDNFKDEIDKIDISKDIPDESKQEQLRKEFKEAVDELAKAADDDATIKDIQAALFRRYITGGNVNNGIPGFVKGNIASRLLSRHINSKERRNQNTEDKTVPFELETQDLNAFPVDSESKTAQYIKNHNIRDNQKTVADVMTEERKKAKSGNQPPSIRAMFLYDPTLAKDVADELGERFNENQIPIILVIPVNEETRKRFGITDTEPGGSQGLIDIGVNNFNRNNEETLYMPIGIMPSTGNERVPSSSRMKTIRDLIDTGINKDDGGATEPHIIRQRVQNQNPKTFRDGTIKESSTRLTTFVKFAEVGDGPQGNRNVDLKEISELGAENASSPEESFVKGVKEEDRLEFEEARKEAVNTGDKRKLRATSLYKKVKEAILPKLFGSKIITDTDEGEDSRMALKFEVRKGSRNTFSPEVMVKPVEQTTHRDNPNRKIIDIIQDWKNATSDEQKQAFAEELIGKNNGKDRYRGDAANNRLVGLFEALSNLFDTAKEKNKQREKDGLQKLEDADGIGWPFNPEWFNNDGVGIKQTQQASYEKAMSEFAELLKKKFDTYLNIAGNPEIEVSLDQTNPIDQKTLTITIKSYNKPIASITLGRTEQEENGIVTYKPEAFQENHFMSLLHQLIFDNDNNVRKSKTYGKNGERFGLVKWQVNYQNAGSEKRIDIDTYSDLYDDGVLELRLTKLAYKPKSVVLNIDPIRDLYNNAEPDASPRGSGNVPQHEVRTATGAPVDANSGIPTGSADITTETPGEDIPYGVKMVWNKLKDLLQKSKTRKLNRDQSGYEINGITHARVTSVKRFFPASKSEKFNEKSPWKTPSTANGNSLDGFGRHVLNGIFDSKTEEERLKEFDGLPNSTAENYNEVYKALKKIQANLAAIGQTILAIGDVNNPGEIVVKGDVPITLANGTTIPFKVGGTLDILAIDSNGEAHIYDFKTYHSDKLDENDADDKDYDIQLSLYAKFLEEEYGLTVASINVIPVSVSYPTPTGVPGGEYDYRTLPGSEQLEIKRKSEPDSEWRLFQEADFHVGDPFSITRIKDNELAINVANMIKADAQQVADALALQLNRPVTIEDVVGPKITEESSEPQQPDNGETLPDPVTMYDEDIQRELTSIGESPKEGIEIGGIANRREALLEEQQKRQEEAQEIQESYPVGVRVHSNTYGDGTVTQIGGGRAHELHVEYDNGDRIFYTGITSIENDGLEVINVSDAVLNEEPPVSPEPENNEQVIEGEEYDNPYYFNADEDEDPLGSMSDDADAMLFGEGFVPSGFQSDVEVSDELHNEEGSKNAIDEQNDACSTK